MDSKLRDKIAGTISEDIRSDCSSGQIADDILDILALELEKARKWDKISPLVKGDCNLCQALSYCKKNDIHPCEILKDALSKEAT